jgi:hypothetical protein
MRQYPALAGDPLPAPVPNLPAGVHACGVNFALDVLTPVQGANDVITRDPFGPGRDSSGCDAQSAPQPGTDTLTIRRADTQPSTPQAGQIQLYTSQLTSRTSQLLFADGIAPGPVDTAGQVPGLNQVHNLIVRMYYVAQDSDGRPGVPSLRMKSLCHEPACVSGGVAFPDKEVLPGVEDLQVQFGIDTGDYNNDGVIDPGIDPNRNGVPQTDGRATRYVNPDFPTLSRYQVVAVRVWVRVRADQPEVGFVDNKPYQYADVSYTPQGADRNYRRVVMSRTVTLRNARTL